MRGARKGRRQESGAIAGFLFDIGAGHYAPPPRDSDPEAWARWQRDLAAGCLRTDASPN